MNKEILGRKSDILIEYKEQIRNSKGALDIVREDKAHSRKWKMLGKE